MAIINVMISIPLANQWGAVGAAVGTAFSLLIGNGLIMNIFYHKALKIDMKYFWKQILRTWKGFVIPAFFAVIIMKYIVFENLKVFFISVFAIAIVYCISILLFSCNEEEKSLIFGMIRRKRR